MRANIIIKLICVLSVRFYSSSVNASDVDESKRAVTYITVDNYCQRSYSNASYMCREHYKTGYDYFCASLYCYDAIYLKDCVYSVPPQDSTLCGNGKWCDGHSCSTNPHAKVTSDTCPLGDSTKHDVVLGISCQEAVAKRPSLCNYEDVGTTWCCDSCGAVAKETPATFNGPTKSAQIDCGDLFGPNSYFCQTDSRYNGDFSSTCSHLYCYNPTKGICEAYPADDGVPCGDGKWCVSGHCVQSSKASADPSTDCLYGNQYQLFCQGNIVYPNIAKYCKQYESGCCDACLSHKNKTNVGCEYGDVTPDVCSRHVSAETIKAYCGTNEADCCDTCAHLKGSGNALCPYGDVDTDMCEQLMNDTIGPGNCYSKSREQECCQTCPKYYNTSNVGCEYGDHWKDYCAQNVKPPNVASECSKYSSQCCGTCRMYEEQGHPGCRYGDTDPEGCEILMKYGQGTGNCYSVLHRAKCCGTCDILKDASTPGCLYGDKVPLNCTQMLNNSKGAGNCYDLGTQIDCCRSCGQIKNDSNIGCEYGDHHAQFCEDNIYNNETAFVCFTNEHQCCETCKQWIVSEHDDCKYGDKNPFNCKFQIQDEAQAASKCPTIGVDCCATCSMYGHPGPAGGIQMNRFLG